MAVELTRPGGGLRLLAAAVAAGVVLAGCADSGPAIPQATDEPTPATSSPVEASSSATPSETPEQAEVRAAWHTFLQAFGAAMRTQDPELEALRRVAAREALDRAQARVLSVEGQQVQGRYVPDAGASVEVDGGDSARVSDCVRLPRIQTAEGEPEDGSGDRYTAEGWLTRTEDYGWVVTDVKVAAERCAPTELQQEVLEAYRSHWRAVEDASADPDNDQLVDRVLALEADPQLSATREGLDALAQAGEAVLGTAQLNPEVVEVRDEDTVAVVRDCRMVREPGTKGVRRVSADGEIITEAKVGSESLWRTLLELHDGQWVVTDQINKDEGEDPCGTS